MSSFCEIDERELFSVYIMRGNKKICSTQFGERKLMHREYIPPDVQSI